MSIKNKIESYRDDFGLVTDNTECRTTQNGVRFTSEIIAGLTDIDYRLELIKSIEKCEMRPGLLRRSPDSLRDQEGPDDYVAYIRASKELGTGFPGRFLAYGTAHGWIFNNVDEGVFTPSSFLGRQIQIIAHAKYAAKITPGFLEQIMWAAAVLFGAFKTGQDDKMLSWHLVSVAENESTLNRVVSWFWRRQLKKHFPNGIGQVLKDYFVDDSHPSIELLWDKF